MIEAVKRKQKIMTKLEGEIHVFIDEFIQFHNRKPLKSEIVENMGDNMNIDILNKLVHKISEEKGNIIISNENNV